MTRPYIPRTIESEIKKGKTLRAEFAKVPERLRPAFGSGRRFLLSLSEEEIKLTREVKALPWWKFDPESEVP